MLSFKLRLCYWWITANSWWASNSLLNQWTILNTQLLLLVKWEIKIIYSLIFNFNCIYILWGYIGVVLHFESVVTYIIYIYNIQIYQMCIYICIHMSDVSRVFLGRPVQITNSHWRVHFQNMCLLMLITRFVKKSKGKSKHLRDLLCI